ncbi:hypothetical protein [Tianweitania populi]|uniref:hypothetical protein n=1 Tax=Tianweitania populi TaxID=1607949 RepID=UPI00167B1DCE|nr:hypothetical protein [Tianweitania populi]
MADVAIPNERISSDEEGLGFFDSVLDRCEADKKLPRIILRNEELEAEIMRVVAERDEANRRNDETQHQIRDLLNSRSWKISAPFRSLGTIARQARGAVRHRFGREPTAEDQANTLEGFVRNHPHLLLMNAASRLDPALDEPAVAFANVAAEAGYGVVFIGWQMIETDALPGRSSRLAPNLFQIGRYDMKELVAVLKHVKPASTTCLVTVPMLEIVQSLLKLEEAGVRVIYHKLQDWGEIAQKGLAPWFEDHLERHLILNADKVTGIALSGLEPIVQESNAIVVGKKVLPLSPARPAISPKSSIWAAQLQMILQ